MLNKTSLKKTGFSIVETMTVLGILSVVSITAVIPFSETRNQTVLQDVHATIFYALEQAQSRAASGVGNTAYGVHIAERKIIVFEGDEYIEGMGDEIALPFVVSTNQSDLNIIFSRISGQANVNATIILTHISGSTKTIVVTEDGRIFSHAE